MARDVAIGPYRVAQDNAAAATVTLTLATPPAGMSNYILAIFIHADTATATGVHVTKNDGTTTIVRQGGAGTGLCNGPVVLPPGGIPCDAADATKVTWAATGASAVNCAVIYQQRQA